MNEPRLFVNFENELRSRRGPKEGPPEFCRLSEVFVGVRNVVRIVGPILETVDAVGGTVVRESDESGR